MTLNSPGGSTLQLGDARRLLCLAAPVHFSSGHFGPEYIYLIEDGVIDFFLAFSSRLWARLDTQQLSNSAGFQQTQLEFSAERHHISAL